MANAKKYTANKYTDIVVTQCDRGYIDYAKGNNREECLKVLKLKPNTKRPYIHYAYGHTSWDVTELGHAVKWFGDEKPPEAVATEYNIKRNARGLHERSGGE